MSSGFSQGEKALTRAAEFVTQGRSDITSRCNQLSDQVAGMSSGWGGQGAVAFQKLMVAWQEKQRTILDALDSLSNALTETERDNVSTDQTASDSSLNLMNRLG